MEKKNNGKPWSDLEDRYIRIYYPNHGPSISSKLERTRSSVKRRASVLRVSVGPNYRNREHPISSEEKESELRHAMERERRVYKHICNENETAQPISSEHFMPHPAADNLTDSIRKYLEENRHFIKMQSFRYQLKKHTRIM